MHGNYTQLYVHCVWATWDKLPLIDAACEREIYACILDKCRALGCNPIAVGGIEDHIHLLAHIPPTLAVTTLVKEVKGASSHLMAHVLRLDVFFRWQGSYGAFTVSDSVVPRVAEYIKNQKQHHANNSLIADWERYEEPTKPEAANIKTGNHNHDL